ncbi:MAG: cytochrome P450, partial [Candidatus Binataceae bacterium]
MPSSAVQTISSAPAPSPAPVPKPAAAKPPTKRRAPGPRGPFAALKLIRPATALANLGESFNRYGDVVHYWLGPIQTYLVAHPDGVKHILQDHHRNYTKSQDYALLKYLLGEGLVTSEGDLWLRQRRLIQPAFHRERIRGFAQIMTDATMEMLERWDKIAAEGSQLDVSHEMMRLTLKIVGHSLLSMDLTGEADAIGANLTIAQDRFGHFDLALLLPFFPTRRNRDFAKA